MKIKRLICLKCGNTEEFIVDVRRDRVAATLYFEDGMATIEDSPSDDIEIFPGSCAKCGEELSIAPSGSWYLEHRNGEVCQHCKYKFSCYTERKGFKNYRTVGKLTITDPLPECRGFEFEDGDEAELEE